MATKRSFLSGLIVTGLLLSSLSLSQAQERLPDDNTDEYMGEYHPAPAYRESESHPLRVLAYIVHPIGWLARELIFRPLSFFASSTPETRAVMGYREPYDYRKPSCFSKSDAVPDCRQVAPFNYDRAADDVGTVGDERSDTYERSLPVDKKNVVYLPDVNFDFNKRTLSRDGKRKVETIAQMLNDGEAVNVELQGNTDKRGSSKYNAKLGMDRARAVRAELVSLGVPAERLSTVSFGEKNPLFQENQDWAHAANRRVEVHLAADKD
jgi:outer membrane protein OmpA-like peptidoglycan-associated protein